MIKQVLFALSVLGLVPWVAKAQFAPTAYYVVDGVEMEATEMISDGQAPLAVTFRANPSESLTQEPSYEWRFTRTGSASPFMVRYEEETTYEFRESGSTTVSLYVAMEPGLEAELVSSITVVISTSVLEMPNAFSPNGDGINDVYRAKDTHRSIVDFHAYIFNRWGQKVYEWTDVNGGWDGSHGGKPAPDGVYYVLVKARGADGREYSIKRDVNLLRKYTEGGTY